MWLFHYWFSVSSFYIIAIVWIAFAWRVENCWRNWIKRDYKGKTKPFQILSSAALLQKGIFRTSQATWLVSPQACSVLLGIITFFSLNGVSRTYHANSIDMRDKTIFKRAGPDMKATFEQLTAIQARSKLSRWWIGHKNCFIMKYCLPWSTAGTSRATVKTFLPI